VNRPTGRIAGVAALLLLAAAPPAAADAPETLQARVANAAFLAQAPPPPTPGAVCVIDSGVDTDTDVAPAIVSRYANDGGTPDDVGALGDDGTTLTKHGTLVSGVIASQLDGQGSSGIWPRAKIISVRVLGGPSTDTTVAAYIAAMTRCWSRPNVRVINLSLAGLTIGPGETDLLQNAINEARDTYQINVVAAAGNEGLPVVAYPAAFDRVLGVGATDATGTRWTSSLGGSNYGIGLDISTLGMDVCVTLPAPLAPGSLLGKASGTSFAAPVVSAVIAAMRSYHPSITADQAETALLSGATTTSAGKSLDAAAAFEYAAVNYDAPALADLVSGYTGRPAFGCTAPAVVDGGSAPVGMGAAANGRPATTATDPSPAVQGPSATDRITAVAPAAAPLTVPVLPAERPAPRRAPTPTLRSVSLRRGVLRIRVSGYRKGMTATFRVNHTRYVRRASTLRVKRRSWTTIRVQFEERGRDASRTLIVRRGQEF
jgi:hypothetical protein